MNLIEDKDINKLEQLSNDIKKIYPDPYRYIIVLISHIRISLLRIITLKQPVRGHKRFV